MGSDMGRVERDDGSLDTGPAEFAVLSALCTKFGFTPIAGTQDGCDLLDGGISQLRRKLHVDQLDLESTLSSHGIPKVDHVPLENIVSLRGDSEALDGMRKALMRALTTAQQRVERHEGRAGQDVFGDAFADEIERLQGELSKELRRRSSLRELVVPYGASLGMGLFALSVDPALAKDVERLVSMLVQASAPALRGSLICSLPGSVVVERGRSRDCTGTF